MLFGDLLSKVGGWGLCPLLWSYLFSLLGIKNVTPDICLPSPLPSSCPMPKLNHSHSRKVLDHHHQEMLAGACQACTSLNNDDGDSLLSATWCWVPRFTPINLHKDLLR